MCIGLVCNSFGNNRASTVGASQPRAAGLRGRGELNPLHTVTHCCMEPCMEPTMY